MWKVRLDRTDEYLPPFALGTWDIRDRGRMVRTIRLAIEVGINHIDTAEMYPGAEETIAQALEGIDRERVFIVSKVLPHHASYEGTIKALEGTLRRLRTDYVDAYLLHWWDGTYPLEETFEAFAKLIEEGKMRYAGVSNFSVRDMEMALKIFSPNHIVFNQVEYNLSSRSAERNILPFCRQHGITMTAYSPLWQGKYPSPKKWRVLEEIAEKYGATPFQIALNFLLTRNPDIIAIFKTENPEHLKENISSLNFRLDDEDLKKIDSEFPA